MDKYTTTINAEIDESIKLAYQNGMDKQQIEILKALKKGYKINKKKKEPITGSFFKLNERKLNALIDVSTKDLKKAEGRILRYTNDVYRKIPYKAQFFANTGATTTWKAVDMAVEEFLKNGINNIEYANGTRVNIASYAEMCIRTANKRAYLTGEGQIREGWGVYTVLVSSHASACPRCQQWQGRVYIDDVWSDGSVEESKELGYPLLSTAINGGLYHPNCKDTHTTYFPGINTEPKEQSKQQLKESTRRYNLEQKQRYYERQVRKYAILEEGSLYIQDERYYREKKNKWQDKYKQHVEDNKDILREAPERVKIRGITSEVFKNDEKSGRINIKIVNDATVVNPMDREKYSRMKQNLSKQGIHVIEANGDDLRYLQAIGAEASYGNKYIMHVGEVPSASAMFEEIIHATQAKIYGKFVDSDELELCAREVAANRMLLRNGEKYGFDKTDFEDIERNLGIWEKRFEKEAGVPYDKGRCKREI